MPVAVIRHLHAHRVREEQLQKGIGVRIWSIDGLVHKDSKNL